MVVLIETDRWKRLSATIWYLDLSLCYDLHHHWDDLAFGTSTLTTILLEDSNVYLSF